MSLQRRLTLFFILIVILPLAAAGFIVQDVVVTEVANRAESSLRPAVNSVVARYNERVSVLEDVTRSSLSESQSFAEIIEDDDRSRTDDFLNRRLEQTNGLDFLVALDTGGDIAGAATNTGEFLSGFSPPTVDEIMTTGRIGPGYVRTQPIKVSSPEDNVGFIVGGFWLDETLLTGTSQPSTETFLAAGDQIIASPADLERVVRVEGIEDGTVEVEVDGNGRGEVSSLGDGEMYVLAWTPFSNVQNLERNLLGALLGLLLMAVIATALLAFVLARLIARPLEELTEGEIGRAHV